MLGSLREPCASCGETVSYLTVTWFVPGTCETELIPLIEACAAVPVGPGPGSGPGPLIILLLYPRPVHSCLIIVRRASYVRVSRKCPADDERRTTNDVFSSFHIRQRASQFLGRAKQCVLRRFFRRIQHFSDSP